MNKKHQTSEQSNYLADTVHTLGLCVSDLNTFVCKRIIGSSWSVIVFKMEYHLKDRYNSKSYDYRQFKQHAAFDICRLCRMSEACCL